MEFYAGDRFVYLKFLQRSALPAVFFSSSFAVAGVAMAVHDCENSGAIIILSAGSLFFFFLAYNAYEFFKRPGDVFANIQYSPPQ